MPDERSTLGSDEHRIDDAPHSYAVSTEIPRSAHDVEVKDGIPDSPGIGPEQITQAGPFARLFFRGTTDRIEAMRALDDLGHIIGERVLREIRAFRREFEIRLREINVQSQARHDVQDAKIDALRELYEGLRKEINGLHKQMRLVVAMLAVVIGLLGSLVTLGFIYWIDMRSEVASPSRLEVQAQSAQVADPMSPSADVPQGDSPPSGDAVEVEETSPYTSP